MDNPAMYNEYTVSALLITGIFAIIILGMLFSFLKRNKIQVKKLGIELGKDNTSLIGAVEKAIKNQQEIDEIKYVDIKLQQRAVSLKKLDLLTEKVIDNYLYALNEYYIQNNLPKEDICLGRSCRNVVELRDILDTITVINMKDLEYNIFIGNHNDIFNTGLNPSLVSPEFDPSITIVSVGIGSIPTDFLPEEVGYDKIAKLTSIPDENSLSLGKIMEKLHEKTNPEELKIGNLKKIEINYPMQFVQVAKKFKIQDSIILSNRTPKINNQDIDPKLHSVFFDTLLLVPIGGGFNETLATEQSRKKIIEIKIREKLAKINEV
jgi:hypothetical protein